MIQAPIRPLLKLLMASVWLSALLFGLYILGYYGIGLITGVPERWNTVLPGLYVANKVAATAGIGVHFLGGGIILILGCCQFLRPLREKAPRWHRVLGRIYVLSALLTGIGGLIFIGQNRTIGGWLMDVAFALYGVLVILAAFQTGRWAMKRDFVQHQDWAIRLFALAIGSWFYRMGYGFWFMVTDKLWHTSTFSGGFDYFMDFFFYLPNLLVAEAIVRNPKLPEHGCWVWLGSLVLVAIIAYVWLATYFFTTHYWWQGIKYLFG